MLSIIYTDHSKLLLDAKIHGLSCNRKTYESILHRAGRLLYLLKYGCFDLTDPATPAKIDILRCQMTDLYTDLGLNRALVDIEINKYLSSSPACLNDILTENSFSFGGFGNSVNLCYVHSSGYGLNLCAADHNYLGVNGEYGCIDCECDNDDDVECLECGCTEIPGDACNPVELFQSPTEITYDVTSPSTEGEVSTYEDGGIHYLIFTPNAFDDNPDNVAYGTVSLEININGSLRRFCIDIAQGCVSCGGIQTMDCEDKFLQLGTYNTMTDVVTIIKDGELGTLSVELGNIRYIEPTTPGVFGPDFVAYAINETVYQYCIDVEPRALVSIDSHEQDVTYTVAPADPVNNTPMGCRIIPKPNAVAQGIKTKWRLKKEIVGGTTSFVNEVIYEHLVPFELSIINYYEIPESNVLQDGGQIKIVRLFRYDGTTNAEQFYDFDVTENSPYINVSAPGTVAVNVNHLRYYSATPNNYFTAISNLLKKSIFAVWGNTSFGVGPTAYILSVNQIGAGRVRINLANKTNPTGVWIGIKKSQGFMLYDQFGLGALQPILRLVIRSVSGGPICQLATVTGKYNVNFTQFFNILGTQLNTGGEVVLFTTANLTDTINVTEFNVTYQPGCEYQNISYFIEKFEFPQFPDESTNVVHQRLGGGNTLLVPQAFPMATPCQSVIGAAMIEVEETFEMADYNTYVPSHPIQEFYELVQNPFYPENNVSSCKEFVLTANIEGACTDPDIEWSTGSTEEQIIIGQTLVDQEIDLDVDCGGCEYNDSITIPSL